MILLLLEEIVDWELFTLLNLVQRSKLGREIELQNAHLDLFRSPGDVMQFSTLSAQLGVRSNVVDSYHDAIYLPYGHLLVDLSPRTDNRIRYCTNTRSIPSKVIYRTDWNSQSFLDNEHTKALYSPCVPNVYPQMQKSFPSALPKRVYQVSPWMYSKSSRRKLAKHKKAARDKTSQRSLIALCKKTTRKQRRDVLATKKVLQLTKVITPPVINQMSWYGAICSGPCFCVPQQKQEFENSGSCKAELPNYQTEQNPLYQILSLKKESIKNLFAKAHFLVDKILSCPRNKLSISQTLLLDSKETKVLLSHFAQQLLRKDPDVPDIKFILLNAAGNSPILVLNLNAKTRETDRQREREREREREKGCWVLFNIWTSEAARAVHAGRCCLWVCAQCSES